MRSCSPWHSREPDSASWPLSSTTTRFLPISEERVGEAAGVTSATGSFGLSFGLAFAGAIMLATLSLAFTNMAESSNVLPPADQQHVAEVLEDDAQIMSDAQLEELLAGQPEEIQDEILSINTDARHLALQVALLFTLLAALVGIAFAFRMMRLPDPQPTSAVEGALSRLTRRRPAAGTRPGSPRSSSNWQSREMRTISVGERRDRLARRHHLTPDAGSIDVAALARRLVGLHASDPATVFLSARARIPGFAPADLEVAMYEQGTVRKHLAMRRTLFAFYLDLLPAGARRVHGRSAGP